MVQVTTDREELFALGLKVLQNPPKLTEEEAHRPKFPKCPFCKGKPEFIPKYGKLLFQTGLDEPATIDIPRFDILPCCSAKYTFEVTWETRAQKLYRVAQERLNEARKSDQRTV